MKILKAVKKLKFWSKKNKRRIKSPKGVIGVSPPSSLHYHCHYATLQPSAPPLPSWIDYEEQSEMDIAEEFGGVSVSVPDPSHSAVVACDSYQQYMVPNPVYGVPVVSEVQREQKGRGFGCAINIGTYLIHCFFPCFHIREAR